MAKDCTNVAITKAISTRRMSSQCPDTGIQFLLPGIKLSFLDSSVWALE
ncbi:hypothetical protein [Wolbachia endosymbiont (group A) of Pogonocherus hispidulus]